MSKLYIEGKKNEPTGKCWDSLQKVAKPKKLESKLWNRLLKWKFSEKPGAFDLVNATSFQMRT